MRVSTTDREPRAGRLTDRSLRDPALRGCCSINCVIRQLYILGADLAQNAGIVVVKRKHKARGQPIAASW